MIYDYDDDDYADDKSLFPGWVGCAGVTAIIILGWVFMFGLIWAANELGMLS